MTHPDRRRYGGLDVAPPDGEEMGPARFDANFDANLAADFSADFGADLEADTSVDFPAAPTGPAAAGTDRKGRE
ncbi:MAG: hypothetical protein ACOY93_11985 [Bacillota bacterium]